MCCSAERNVTAAVIVLPCIQSAAWWFGPVAGAYGDKVAVELVKHLSFFLSYNVQIQHYEDCDTLIAWWVILLFPRSAEV